MKVGKLKVVCGSMFSGKSTELLRQGRRHELAGRRVLYVKPKIDTRYSANEIVTHDQIGRLSRLIADGFELMEIIQGADGDYHAVCIDEAQFFDGSLLLAIDELLAMGIEVICSGLDMDRHGKPFGIMPYLLAVADEITKVHAVCSECGADGWISYGDFEAAGQVVLGAGERYRPLCRACAFKKRKERASK